MDKLARFHHINYHPNASGDQIPVGKGEQQSPMGDLHMHTSFSDGIYTPEEVIRKAKKRGLAAISITDHDSVNGIDEAIETGLSSDIEIIPGIELSAMCGNLEVHVLGYFIDHRDKELQDYLVFFRTQRIKRAREMVRRLNDLKIPVTIDHLIDNAEGRSIGRPHIAEAVLETGSVNTYLEVFHKYIGFGCPAYVEKYRLDIHDAVGMIAKAGGLSFIAHPSDVLRDTVLPDIIQAGIDGIETVHPSLNNQKSKYYRGIAQEYYLLESGGSDFHGGKRGDDAHIGSYRIPLDYIDAMRKRLVA